jgi:hydrogenase maturation factor HypF (carbamoyltransferase family)
MKRCRNCGGRFGLIRHQIITLSGRFQVCSKKCKEEFLGKLAREYRAGPGNLHRTISGVSA